MLTDISKEISLLSFKNGIIFLDICMRINAATNSKFALFLNVILVTAVIVNFMKEMKSLMFAYFALIYL